MYTLPRVCMPRDQCLRKIVRGRFIAYVELANTNEAVVMHARTCCGRDPLGTSAYQRRAEWLG